MFNKDSYCGYCSADLLAANPSPIERTYPKFCRLCANVTYNNPSPVVGVLLSVWKNDKLGCLIQQRGIEPEVNKWALTTGYMDHGETWQETAVRELQEEIGLVTSIKDYQLMEVTSSVSKENLLVFSVCTRVFDLKEIPFVSNQEVLAIDVAHKPIELAFPSHTEMLSRYLGNRKLLELAIKAPNSPL